MGMSLYPDYKQLMAIMRLRGLALRALAIVIGAITLVSWLFIDDLSLKAVWVNQYTPAIAALFSLAMALFLFTSLRDKKTDKTLKELAFDSGEAGDGSNVGMQLT